MKIVALLPVKNEAWILPLYLEAISPIVDSIIAFDDNSTDASATILKNHPKTELYKLADLNHELDTLVDMSARRKFLLNKAREAGATHQIWLDADEIIPSHFYSKIKSAISKMKPGQKLIMPWITLWKTPTEQRVDKVWKKLSKDFIFCDDGVSIFSTQKLSEGRTPSNTLYGNERIVVDIPVAHYQFVFFKRAMIKQAWYRCHELLQGVRSARRINATYSISEDNPEVQTIRTPAEWSLNDPSLNNTEMSNFKVEESSYFKDILKWFDECDLPSTPSSGPQENKRCAKFFEGLNIWNIKELRDAFIARVGREPKAQVFPWYILRLNEFRHLTTSFIYKIKNLLFKK